MDEQQYKQIIVHISKDEINKAQELYNRVIRKQEIVPDNINYYINIMRTLSQKGEVLDIHSTPLSNKITYNSPISEIKDVTNCLFEILKI
ncbi:hypothetical protein J4403_04020 [Candidatus Woesearchaeota archaeon]|nr:hypothetical protein [Candidatus Woesearchaeota archaeon]